MKTKRCNCLFWGTALLAVLAVPFLAWGAGETKDTATSLYTSPDGTVTVPDAKPQWVEIDGRKYRLLDTDSGYVSVRERTDMEVKEMSVDALTGEGQLQPFTGKVNQPGGRMGPSRVEPGPGLRGTQDAPVVVYYDAQTDAGTCWYSTWSATDKHHPNRSADWNILSIPVDGYPFHVLTVLDTNIVYNPATDPAGVHLWVKFEFFDEFNLTACDGTGDCLPATAQAFRDQIAPLSGIIVDLGNSDDFPNQALQLVAITVDLPTDARIVVPTSFNPKRQSVGDTDCQQPNEVFTRISIGQGTGTTFSFSNVDNRSRCSGYNANGYWPLVGDSNSAMEFDADGTALNNPLSEDCDEFWWYGAATQLQLKLSGKGVSDCQPNGIPDDQDIADGAPDVFPAGGNGIPDACDLADCNTNGCPDACDLACGSEVICTGDPQCNCASPLPDCNGNGKPDDCDIAGGGSHDINSNGLADECEDCNLNGIPDDWDADPNDPDTNGLWSPDCDGSGTLDECERFYFDCNGNGQDDWCDIVQMDSNDADANSIPDECPSHCPFSFYGFETAEGYVLGNIHGQPNDVNSNNWTLFNTNGASDYALVKTNLLCRTGNNGLEWTKLNEPSDAMYTPFFTIPENPTQVWIVPSTKQEFSYDLTFSRIGGSDLICLLWDAFAPEGTWGGVVGVYIQPVNTTSATWWLSDSEVYESLGVPALPNICYNVKITIDFSRFNTPPAITNAGHLVITRKDTMAVVVDVPFTPNRLSPSYMVFWDEPDTLGGTPSYLARIDQIRYCRWGDIVDCSAFFSEDCDANNVCDFWEMTAANDRNANNKLDICESPCLDCNFNFVVDSYEIAQGSAPDANTNGIIDWCESGIAQNFDAFALGSLDNQFGWMEARIVGTNQPASDSQVVTSGAPGFPTSSSQFVQIQAADPADQSTANWIVSPRQAAEDADYEEWKWDMLMPSSDFGHLFFGLMDMCGQYGPATINDSRFLTELANDLDLEQGTVASRGAVNTLIEFIGQGLTQPTGFVYAWGQTGPGELQFARTDLMDGNPLVGSGGAGEAHRWNEKITAIVRVYNSTGQIHFLTADRSTGVPTSRIGSLGYIYQGEGWIDQTINDNHVGGDRQLFIGVYEGGEYLSSPGVLVPAFGNAGTTKFALDTIGYTTGSDCNHNSIPDSQDKANHPTWDSNGDNILDSCQDCNNDNIGDWTQLGANDCNNNSIPDECDIKVGLPCVGWFVGGTACANVWGMGSLSALNNPDGSGLLVNMRSIAALDCNSNGDPDSCDGPDCNNNGCVDTWDISQGTSADANGDQIADECQADCNYNNVVDSSDITGGTSIDFCPNFVPDGIPDECCLAAVAPDVDHDGDIDADDFAFIQRCAGIVTTEGDVDCARFQCGCADLNHDGVVNSSDVLQFEMAITGPQTPPNGK